MRRRIVTGTGLGNSEPVRLDNNIVIKRSKLMDSFLDDILSTFTVIKRMCGYDVHLDENGFTFGVEPSYQYDDLQIIHISFKDKGNCYIENGRAWGPYGSDCLIRRKFYSDYKAKSKFVPFIDKWYDKIVAHFKKRVK